MIPGIVKRYCRNSGCRLFKNGNVISMFRIRSIALVTEMIMSASLGKPACSNKKSRNGSS
ncbi:MAG: hypothetical protein DMF95_09330 [Acidobacteria bacterium]|nr:MAG: hypothetical protein DMF95_09330 [Acidobacteriota bacterium]